MGTWTKEGQSIGCLGTSSCKMCKDEVCQPDSFFILWTWDIKNLIVAEGLEAGRLWSRKSGREKN